MESINLNEVCLILGEDEEILYILYHDWIFIYFLIIYLIILLLKIVILWLIILKIAGYFINAVKTKADPLMLEEHFNQHQNDYPLIYRIRKSKLFNYIYHQCSELVQKYKKRKPSNEKKLKGKTSQLFGYRGGHMGHKDILKIIIESHDTQIPVRSGRIRSIQANLQIIVNGKVLAKLCAKIGILVGSVGSRTLVPRIVGLLIGNNVLLKPIDDGKFLSQFNPTSSFIERIEKGQNRVKISPEISPKQILFLPGPRNSNQVTIVTLGSKFKLMSSPQVMEKTSQCTIVPLSERTKTLQDLVGSDYKKIDSDAELILAPQVKQKKLKISID